MKIAVLVSWRTTPVSLCQSNDLQIEIQKRGCSYRNNVTLNFLLFGFETISYPSCHLATIVVKTNHWPVTAPFSVRLLQRF